MQAIEKIFLAAVLFFGLIFVFVNPPFQSPDEPEHLFRMYGYTQGKFNFEVVDGKAGLYIPESFFKLKNMFYYLQANSFATTSADMIKQAGKIELNPEKTMFLAHGVPSYLPISYFPALIFLKLFLMMKLPPLIILYLLRIIELFLYTGLMWLAIRLTPVKKGLFAMLALLPMAIYMGCSVNTDALVLGLAFVLCAYIFRLAYDERIEKVGKVQIGIVCALMFCLTICKLAYAPVCLMFFLIPKKKFQSQNHKLLMFGTVLCCAVLAMVIFILCGMNVFHSSLSTTLTAEASEGGSGKTNILLVILKHPFYFWGRCNATLVLTWDYLIKTFVGCFGWLDTQLPFWLVVSYVLALIACALAKEENEPDFSFGIREKVILFFAFYFSFVITAISSYLVFRKALPFILGVQGRYLIPLAVVIFMMFCSDRFKLKDKDYMKLVGYFSVFGLILSVYFLVVRFYFTVYV